MAHDFIPRRDADFLGWSGNFSQSINNSPGDFGLSPAQATDYASLNDAFAAAYQIAFSTRSRTSVSAKNTARRAVERNARMLARIIQATPSVTDAQKSALRLTVRDVNPSSVPRPVESPRLFVKLLHGSTVRITLMGNNTDRRGKPAGVAGAMVFSFVGDAPPATLSQWKNEGGFTRPRIDITLTGENIRPGSKVWFTAYWFNPRAQRGPASMPKCTYIQCPTMLLGNSSLRLAA